ncbi:MAG TPA: heavy metal sensor histidine kinase [Terriglobia bacterium]|nr:heavy metal sensor histidine kinase [Terriglobia bacterium]
MTQRRVWSLRTRLTLSYTAAMVVVLAVYAVAVLAFVNDAASRALDDNLRQDFAIPQMMLRRETDGSITRLENTDEQDKVLWLQVWIPGEKEPIYRSWRAIQRPVPDSDRLAALADDRIHPVYELNPAMRILSAPSRIGGQAVIVQVARSEYAIRDQMRELRRLLLLGLPLGVVVAGLGGYSLARRALAPVEAMGERARLITAERLGDRLPVDNPNDELGRLATVFNETLGRLELSFDQMRRFTADASHELRTPLTALRSVGEVGLRGKRDPVAYREIIGSMLEEVDRLSRLVDRLLTLSRADNREFQLAVETVSLGGLASEVADQMEVLAEEKGQSIRVEQEGDPRWTGDPLVLRQAIMNLVDNAIKYTPDGGQITLRVASAGTESTIDVRDTGPGIPPAQRSRIFDRFYRVDSARSRDHEGAGLGLSIAKWAVEVNNGKLSLVETGEASGSLFRITLPAAPAPAAARE